MHMDKAPALGLGFQPSALGSCTNKDEGDVGLAAQRTRNIEDRVEVMDATKVAGVGDDELALKLPRVAEGICVAFAGKREPGGGPVGRNDEF